MTPASLWRNLPFFWKTYIGAVILVGIIVCAVEATEEIIPLIVASGKMPPAIQQFIPDELVLWILGILIPTAIGCRQFSIFLTREMRHIIQATDRLASGDLQTRIPVASERRDEFARLALSFNQMAGGMEGLIANERRLLYDISHELRSPLTRMTLAVELAKPKTEQENTRYLERMEQDIRRMSVMIDQLLEQSRGELSLHSAETERFDIATLLRELADLASFEGAGRGKRVTLCLKTPLIFTGNRAMLEKALGNVISNGLRYTPSEQSLEITAETAVDRAILITVRDFGPGVPEEALEHIFRPFYRIDEARDKESGGVGLGLTMAKNYIHRHSGSIAASAAHPGLTVTIRLPG